MKFKFAIPLLFALSLVLFSCSSKGKKPKDKLARLHYSTGTQSLVKKDYTSALENLIKANQLKPNDTEINNNLGMAYFFKGDFSSAQAHLLKAIEIDPKNSDARNNLASFYFHQNKFNLSKAQYEIVLKDLIYKHQYRTKHNLALIHFQQRNYAVAETLLEEALKDKLDYCAGHFLLGKIRLKQKNYPNALKNFYEAGKGTCVKYPAPVFQQGITLTKMQQWDKAFLKFKEIVDRFATSAYSAKAMSKMRQLDLRRNSPKIPEISFKKSAKKKVRVISQKDLNQFEATNF
ncbi:MAG: tetratricopeptide repeat protein [Halobacteriovoraceae bacterium]|nr:tetratricopeptide repeat protein [Halobacteriovoraceae bacterium]MBT5092726.1 tetratricopeptide repeat protein [Halobacteriovoraceae bacterium]